MKVYMPGFLLMELLLALSISVLMIIIVGQTLALIYSKSIPWCQLIQLCHETTPAGNSQSSSYPRYCYKEYSESVTITNEFGED